MRRLAMLFLVAVPIYADALDDVRGALTSLAAATPIRATFELQRNELDEETFADGNFAGKAVVDLVADGSSFRLVMPRSMLERFRTMPGPKMGIWPTWTERALNHIATVVAAAALTFGIGRLVGVSLE